MNENIDKALAVATRDDVKRPLESDVVKAARKDNVQ
jgi:hypothetical protein